MLSTDVLYLYNTSRWKTKKNPRKNTEANSLLFRLLCNFLVGIYALESMGLKLHLIRAPISKTTNLGHDIKMFKPLLKECLLIEPCYRMDKLVCTSRACMHKFQYLTFFLISNFRCVLNVVCFLLGNSMLSEFYMPSLSQSFQLAQSIFEPNRFPYKYLNIF